MEGTSATGIAVLLAAVIALTKVIEWLIKRYSSNDDPQTAKLDYDQSRQLRDIHEKFILFERDMREMKKKGDNIADAMLKIAECVKKATETNEKVASIVEKIDRRQEVDGEIRRRTGNGLSTVE